MAAPEIGVEVVYALPERQILKSLRVAPGTTAAQAVRTSGLLEEFPQIDPQREALGVFGRRVEPDYVLVEGDRVEIYRALRIDPKEARWARVREQRGSARKA